MFTLFCDVRSSITHQTAFLLPLNMPRPKTQDAVKWFQVLLALAILIPLCLCYAELTKTPDPSWFNLFLDSIPSAVVVLIAVPLVYFALYRPGFTEAQLGEDFLSDEIAQLVADKIGSKQTYSYIDGEDEALEALTVATRRAKRQIRATRFFPLPIRPHHPEYAEAIRERVLGLNGSAPLEHYFRIIAVNNAEKLDDVLEYVANFRGKPFTLYLVNFSNDFELVIIDEDEAFIHFYGERKVISSTLHLRGKEVARKFEAIFTRLHEPLHGREIHKVDCKYITGATMESDQIGIRNFFERTLELRKRRKNVAPASVTHESV